MDKDINNISINGLLLCCLGIFPSILLGITPFYIILIIGGAVTTIAGAIKPKEDITKLFKGIILADKARDIPELIPKLISTIQLDTRTEYTVTLPEGLDINFFECNKLSFEQYFNSKVEFGYKDKTIIIKVYKDGLRDNYPFEVIKTKHPCTIVLGYMLDGLYQFQLKQNMLICGTAGYGKSTLLRGILTQLILNSNKKTLALNLVDFKRTELGLFKFVEQAVTFCTDITMFKNSLLRLEKEALRRYDLFEKEGLLDIYKYNEIHSKKLPLIITIIEEIGQLEGNPAIMNMLSKRLSFDRAAGILYILTTQRPSATILPGDIKANVDIRICFKTVDSTNSWIVLDQKETAEYLTIKGRGLCKMDGELKEFQAMYLNEDDVKKLIKHKEVKNVNKQG